MKILFTFLISLTTLIVSGQMSYKDFQESQLFFPPLNKTVENKDYVVMISLDGFRYDYARKYGASNLLEMAENGVSAERLIPSFPSKTFPNHYTLVTGLYPGNHGLVGNKFYSRSRDEWYDYKNKSAVTDGSWYQGTPLWVAAEQQGLRSASLFWVGSEAEIAGIRPTYSYVYNGSVPNGHRIRQIQDWLQLPSGQRPHLILAYFSLIDDLGHRFGIDHPKTKAGVLQMDSLIGQLRNELKEMELPVHLVLVSDHGMSNINRGLVLAEMVDLGKSKVSYGVPTMIYNEDTLEITRIYDELNRQELVRVYRANAVPNYLSFQNKDRIGDLILLTNPPTVIVEKPRQVSGGTHGFDPLTEVGMGAIFYAEGPQLKRGFHLPPIENIDIYPFVSRLLELKQTGTIDGNSASTKFSFK